MIKYLKAFNKYELNFTHYYTFVAKLILILIFQKGHPLLNSKKKKDKAKKKESNFFFFSRTNSPLSQDRAIFALVRIPFSVGFRVLFEGVGALTGCSEG